MRSVKAVLVAAAVWVGGAGTAVGEPGTGTGAPPGPEAYLSPGGVGPRRGWYVWRHWNPRTREVEISKDPPGEVWTARVLPWTTTYRYLTYGASPDELLPGERVNLFLAPDATNPRAYVCHFQDEVGQMKGHGHSWEIRTVDPSARRFTASLHLGTENRTELTELGFDVDRHCEFWKAGVRVAALPFAPGDRIYLTWIYRGERRVAKLAADDASLNTLRQREETAVRQRLAREGIGGRVEEVQGAALRLMLFSTYWAQARELKPGTIVQLALATADARPTGKHVPVEVVSVKPGGPHGSGPVDLRLRVPESAAESLRSWTPGTLIRVIDPAGEPESRGAPPR